MDEPLRPDRVKALVLQALTTGRVYFRSHALKALKDDKLTTLDAERALRGGVAREGELVRDEWRYRVSTRRLTVVVTFVVLDPPDTHVVTCFAHLERK